MHDQSVTQLKTTEISSDVYTIAPTQMEYIAKLIGDTVADNMNMRALQTALQSARHMGEGNHK